MWRRFACQRLSKSGQPERIAQNLRPQAADRTILVRNQLGQSPRKSWREVVTVTADDGAKAYAYQKPEGRIAWGVNAPETGVNILRGIRRPDGADEAEG